MERVAPRNTSLASDNPLQLAQDGFAVDPGVCAHRSHDSRACAERRQVVDSTRHVRSGAAQCFRSLALRATLDPSFGGADIPSGTPERRHGVDDMRSPITFDSGASDRFRLTWRRTVLAAAALIVGSTATVFMAGTVSAHDNDRIRPCGLRTLRGYFGLVASGARIVPFGPNAGKTESVVGTGLRTYDGSGGFTESGPIFTVN
ncbi:MAG: hypothetical protein ABIX28_01875 [Vicinamibacterales bacterium]